MSATGKEAASPKPFDRAAVISTLARASQRELSAALDAIGQPDGWSWLRAPETGLVMVRGRIGGGGPPFNLGEASVTRASVQLRGGQTGHAYALSRNRKAAGDAALLDALWQTEAREEVEDSILRPVRSRIATQDALEEAEAAATTVDFFTLVRGDD
ncbi:MAG: phosphonate C-P lyase system protein PhnG [Pseudomonadota bacterium]